MKPFSGYLPDDRSVFPFGGLAVAVPETMADPKYSPRLRNVHIRDGELQTRKGYRQVGSQLEASNILHLVEFYTLAGVRLVVAFTAARQYKLDATSETWDDVTQRGTSYALTGVSTGSKQFSFQPGSDITSQFPAGTIIIISGSTSNDGEYTVASSTWSPPDLTLTVDEVIPDGTVDGNLAKVILWTGDFEDKIHVTQGVTSDGRWLIATNGRDDIIRWNGTDASFTALDMSTFTDFERANTLAIYNDLLVLGNIQDSGDQPQMVAWSDTGDFEEWSTGNSGFVLLSRAIGDVLKILPLADLLVVYTQNSIELMSYVGGQAILATSQAHSGLRIPSSQAIVSLGVYHLFLGLDNIYGFDGTGRPFPVGGLIARELRSDLRSGTSKDAFAFHHVDQQTIYWVISTGDSTQKVYVQYYNLGDLQSSRWVVYKFSDKITAGSLYSKDSGLTYDSPSIDLIAYTSFDGTYDDLAVDEGLPVPVFGSSNGEVFALETVSTDDGSNYEAYWDSIDFTIPREYLSTYGRWLEIELELRGSTVDVYYSTDRGSTYSLAETLSLSSDWQFKKVLIDVTSKNIRIRLYKSGSSGFSCRLVKVWAKSGGL